MYPPEVFVDQKLSTLIPNNENISLQLFSPFSYNFTYEEMSFPFNNKPNKCASIINFNPLLKCITWHNFKKKTNQE